MERSRELWIDVLKGIAIVCVILGHTFIYGDRVYYFHMPLFFLIGGYLFKRGQSWMHLFRKTTKRIVFPFIVYLLVLYFLTPYPPSKWCILWGGECLKGVFGVAWFCPVYSFSLLLLWFVPKKLYARLVVVLLLYIVCFVMPDVHFLRIQGIRVVPMALCYMVVGTIFQDFDNIKRIKRVSTNYLLLALFNVILLLSLPNLRIDMKYASYGLPIVTFLSSLILAICIGLISIFIAQQTKYISKMLAYLGKNTLSYMFVHQYVNYEIFSSIFGEDKYSLKYSMLIFWLTLLTTIFVVFFYEISKKYIFQRLYYEVIRQNITKN